MDSQGLLAGSGRFLEIIRSEIMLSTPEEARAYLDGASRDGTLNGRHKTWRISQRDTHWLFILQMTLERCGARSWIYREGQRNVHVVETSMDLRAGEWQDSLEECLVAFARGYFDAEGGLPQELSARFYIQLVQKDRRDLELLRGSLTHLGIATGRIHNPSVKADPNYWRFYVLSSAHETFARVIRSWHPRKRRIFSARFGLLNKGA